MIVTQIAFSGSKHDLIGRKPSQGLEIKVADPGDGGAIDEIVHLLERYLLAGLQASLQARRSRGFAKDEGSRIDIGLEITGHTGRKPAATDGQNDEIRLDAIGQLLHHLGGNGRLPFDNVEMVEGWNHETINLFNMVLGCVIALVEEVAKQLDGDEFDHRKSVSCRFSAAASLPA